MASDSPFRRVVDDLTDGCGCACHTGLGYNAACEHCWPSQWMGAVGGQKVTASRGTSSTALPWRLIP